MNTKTKKHQAPGA